MDLCPLFCLFYSVVATVNQIGILCRGSLPVFWLVCLFLLASCFSFLLCLRDVAFRVVFQLLPLPTKRFQSKTATKKPHSAHLNNSLQTLRNWLLTLSGTNRDGYRGLVSQLCPFLLNPTTLPSLPQWHGWWTTMRKHATGQAATKSAGCGEKDEGNQKRSVAACRLKRFEC